MPEVVKVRLRTALVWPREGLGRSEKGILSSEFGGYSRAAREPFLRRTRLGDGRLL